MDFSHYTGDNPEKVCVFIGKDAISMYREDYELGVEDMIRNRIDEGESSWEIFTALKGLFAMYELRAPKFIKG